MPFSQRKCVLSLPEGCLVRTAVYVLVISREAGFDVLGCFLSSV